ncbi:MAG: DUF4124 domain-containing protein [Neisseriaceae bacterium]|nr:DUF4124 domain-containing protein [Neisseriaceae bacterium]
MILAVPMSLAETYVCVDKNGNKTYTDKANLDTCSISQLGALNTYSANLAIKVAKKNTKTTKKSSNIKKVSNNKKSHSAYSNTVVSKQTQTKRDATRKQILSNELKNEMQALANIRGKIRDAHSKNNQTSIPQLEQQASEHQQNIDVISKELSRI